LNHTPRLVHCRLVIDLPDEEPRCQHSICPLLD
jgi:hypothetical protein